MEKGEKKGKLKIIRDWKNNRDHLGWIIREGKGFKRYILGFLLINLVSMLLSLVSSVASKYVVDAATNYNTGIFFKYIIIMLSATIFTIVFNFFSTLFSSYVGEKYSFSVRSQMFDRVQRSKWMGINKYHSGDILSRLTSDVTTISNGIISIVPNIVVTVIQLIIVLYILLRYDPAMAIIGLIVGPCGVIASVAFRKKYVKYQKQLRESESEYYSFFQESLANLTVIKSFQLEDDNNAYCEDIKKRRLKLVQKSAKLSAVMSAIMKVVYSLGYVAAFSWCAYRLSNPNAFSFGMGEYTYGTMTLFLSLVAMVQGTIRSLGSVIPQTFTMLVSAKRLRQITDIENEDYSEDKPVPDRVGLQVRNVCFTYDSERVLDNISLSVRPSQRVGIVGSSGAGKTTFIRLLLSIVSPDSGSIEYVDSHGNAEIASPSTRRLISYVPQGNTLLSGTIRKNLLVSDKEATDQEIWDALVMSDAAEFVRKCPNGLDTELSEKAGGISEGQAQRIAIARALLRDRPVLILDEATSALDEFTEARIFQQLADNSDKTCFIITHRRSMLVYCDTVVEIDDDGNFTVRDNTPSGTDISHIE